MNILVINGSPKGERSDTLKITKAFLEGIGETAEIVDTMKVDVKPCLGCYACWSKTPGRCVQQDDMAGILKKMVESDLVIWSTPLYCYSVPANCKAVLDRLLPLTQMAQLVDENGKTYHPTREKHKTKSMLISGCGFPDRINNFEALEFQFKRIFGDNCPMILCVEAPLLSIAEAKPLADGYLALAKRAGEEYRKNGCVSKETQSALDAPMFPPEQYRARTTR
jgi:multimeric flavodoxin WrbA